MPEITFTTKNAAETVALGNRLGKRLRGGEVLELLSDLGGGKTTFVSGLSQGFGSTDPVSSPSFTINNVYSRKDNQAMYHFDFYRLHDAGVVGAELAEVEGDSDVVVVVEWGQIVHDVLPKERIIINITASNEQERQFLVVFPATFSYLFEELA